MGLCAPPARHPWHGQAVCWAALMSRRMAFLEAAAEDMGRERNAEGMGADGRASGVVVHLYLRAWVGAGGSREPEGHAHGSVGPVTVCRA